MRKKAAIDSRLRIGDVVIDLVARRVTIRNRPVDLSPIERSILYALATRCGEVLSRETILDLVGGDGAQSNVIDHHVANLRAKICLDRAHPRYVRTALGKGYYFTC